MRLHAFLISAPEGGYVSFNLRPARPLKARPSNRPERLSKDYSPYFSRHRSSGTALFPTCYQARREYRRTCEAAGKSGKQIERCVIASFRVAESMGFKGGFRHWEELLRIGGLPAL